MVNINHPGTIFRLKIKFMKWIVSLITVVFLIVMIIIYLAEKEKHPEKRGILLVLISFLVYHIGDIGLWAGYHYELVRRIASIGFYFEIPFMLLLMYYLVPKEKRSMFMRIFTLIMMLPWLIALLLVYGYPLVFLEEMGGKSENLMYTLVLCFIVAIIFMAIYGFKAAKNREDAFGKKLSRLFAIASIILIIMYLFFWSTMDAFNYDATFLFGIATVTWTIIIRAGSCKCKEIKRE